MTKYKIIFAPTAEKQFLKLNKLVRMRVAAAIAKLATNPYLGKSLKAQLNEYRSYRVGDYRVIYFIRKKEVEIAVVSVAHRKKVYR